LLRLYPKDKSILEFDKIRELLIAYCNGAAAKERAANLSIYNDYEIVNTLLLQANEFSTMLKDGDALPIKYSLHLFSELNLLRIQNAVLNEEQFFLLKELALSIESSFRFFKNKPTVYPVLAEMISDTYFEKKIVDLIEHVIDIDKSVRSNASPELQNIRSSLQRRRSELNKMFAKAIQRLSKEDKLVDIEQSIRNGRKVLAIYSEHKRQVKGILHGMSDTGKTSFIEPEETVQLNNDIYELEQAERQEIYRILKELTANLFPFHSLLVRYQEAIVSYDLLYAKAKLAVDMNGVMPHLIKGSSFNLISAYHPLLYLYNKKLNKPTNPLSLLLNQDNRILIISGPNAGGKTICLKLVGLLQIMIQCGLLIPVDKDSELGIFDTLMISIGDTQSIEYELSTYSAHLKMMKHFCLYADKHTLFLIDEFGTGSDPTMGGAFAESILENLAANKAIGIVTTHYMNLKTMANQVKGIINGAMEFDETNLKPLYKLQVGKPGSSYTFAIADRIGIPKKISERAKELVNKNHFKLENILRDLQKEKQELKEREHQIKEFERELKLKENHLEQVIKSKEVQIETEVNKRTKNEFQKVKETEQRLRQLISEWNKTKDKSKISIKISELISKANPRPKNQVLKTKKGEVIIDSKDEVSVGDEVRVKTLNRIGKVIEINKKKIKVNMNGLPIEFDKEQIVKVKRIEDK
jgi:DNA mismatch repair protein MutS2